ncbi:hypothetical protein MVLG_03369 [Microbotryum lychnidis-dioicae p1A1 Lamole]|uniref:Store-operated calcium entry-associated regulatory factor n=2 Tax=Microbotryum TaxID=34416 RepID=U5H801_USTV1|nr:hypothetical protein MVLG_03369 [Microbotryum lychnidis-dioicae p1A1 Lamole]SGY81466.1 BQ5605_C009g05500 [Microbotryum silenes-dioicae]|eukprot:KDE06331.1 hypothetical protein MVLG_03369 [Microbotryum lychnidis-dioicae p1A1 Lamole]
MTRSQRIKMTSLKALTLHSGQSTNYRRTSPVPQLTCLGKECRRYEPDVVQCTAVGEDGAGGLEWSCTAELPSGVRFGTVEVGCEGWEGPDDPYILRGSCGLTYELVRTSPALENGYGYTNPLAQYGSKSFYDAFFNIAFTAVTLFVLYRLFMSWYNRRPATRGGGAGTRSNRGGWGGGGGWWPGGGGGGGGGGGAGSGPPPPYSAKPDPATTTSQGWRPGFWSGIAAGALGAAAMNQRGGARSRFDEQRDFERYRDGGWDRGVGGSGSWGFGGGGGGGGGLRSRDSGSEMGSMRASTGFGGTRNR